jgi:hypothetical protein
MVLLFMMSNILLPQKPTKITQKMNFDSIKKKNCEKLIINAHAAEILIEHLHQKQEFKKKNQLNQ